MYMEMFYKCFQYITTLLMYKGFFAAAQAAVEE